MTRLQGYGNLKIKEKPRGLNLKIKGIKSMKILLDYRNWHKGFVIYGQAGDSLPAKGYLKFIKTEKNYEVYEFISDKNSSQWVTSFWGNIDFIDGGCIATVAKNSKNSTVCCVILFFDFVVFYSDKTIWVLKETELRHDPIILTLSGVPWSEDLINRLKDFQYN